MTAQTRSWQSKVLAGAKDSGYRDLYWFVSMVWAAGQREAPAAYPGRHVPVVPVGACPEASRRIAGMLAHLFRLSNPARITWNVALTSVEALQQTGCVWYDWTEDVEQDAVCTECGAIERVGHTMLESAPWLCTRCAEIYQLNQETERIIT